MNSAGSASVRSINGGIEIRNSNLKMVDVHTYNGNVLYSGLLSSDGAYALWTFNGTAKLEVSADASARIEASSVKGLIDTSSIRAVSKNGDAPRQTIVIGSGSARVKLQTFDGDITVATITNSQIK